MTRFWNGSTWVDGAMGAPGQHVAVIDGVETWTRVPRIAPIKIACLGDSLCDNNSGINLVSSPKTYTLDTIGFLTWANILLGQRLYFHNDLNFGVGGEDSTQITARVSSVVAAAPDYCVVLAGTNDSWVLTPAATTVANLTAIYTALRNAGITVIAMPLPPRSNWNGLSAPNIVIARKISYAVNRWIRKYATENPGIILVDTLGQTTDPASATADPVSGLFPDGIHPGVSGAQRMGKVLAAALAGSIPTKSPRLPSHNLDIYDATYNPAGNLLTNGAQRGTAGTKSAEFSGNVADSWQAARNGGSYGSGSAVCAKVTRTDGIVGEWQQVTFSGFTGGSLMTPYILRTTVANTLFATGDVIEAECEIEFDSPVDIHGIALTLTERDNTTTIAYSRIGTGGATYFLDEGFKGILRTQPLTVTHTVSGTSTLRCDVEVYVNGASGGGASGVVRVGRVSARKVLS